MLARYTARDRQTCSAWLQNRIGCSDEEIGSITGMSPPMIRSYLRFANQKRLAKAVMRRLEG